jgi:2-C-methyl-D-erythritol 4-phosphate cytidylyltransferase
VSTVAILVAAGAGVRMGAGRPKALIPLAGRPMLAWSLDALERSARIDGIVVVVPDGAVDEARAALGPRAAAWTIMPGGDSRAASVRAGLGAAPHELERVLVHDAARPLLRAELVGAVLDGLEGADGAIAAAPVADTLKRVGDDLLVTGTVRREGLWGAQTPQAFAAAPLRRAVEGAAAAGRLHEATDCASLVEAAGGRVRIVPSGAPNLKVTTPADLAVAEALLAGAR